MMRGRGRSYLSLVWALAPCASMTAAAGSVAGCRSCAEDDGRAARPSEKSPQPTMPTGMLVPIAAPPSSSASASAGAGTAPAPVEGATGELRVMHNLKAGTWTELQRARPGDRPDRAEFQRWRDDSRFVSLDAMTLLHEPFARALPGFDLFLPRLFGPAALAKLATELEAFAKRSRGTIAATASELGALAKDLAQKDESLWVLGP
jgi:hypothetical protein